MHRSGILWFRNSEAAASFAEQWAMTTLNLDSVWSDDQGVFNRLLTNGLYPV